MEDRTKLAALFQLVGTLDDRERRLIRRQLGQNLRNGKSHYLDLFNLVASMEQLDAEAVQNQIPNLGGEGQFASLLSRLFDQVMEFLRSHERFPTVDAQLNAACERIEIMYERGLFAEAGREIKKAQKLALRHENFLQLLRLANLERSHFILEHSRHTLSFQEARAYRDKEWIAQLERQVRMTMASFDLHLFNKLRKPHQIDEAELEAMLEGRTAFRAMMEAKASVTDLLMLDIIGMKAQQEGDFDLAYMAYSKMDDLWVSSPDMVTANATIYITFMTSFLNACLVKGRFVEFKNLLANLKTVQFGKPSLNHSLKELLLYTELIYFLNQSEFEKGLLMEKDIDEFLKRHQRRIPPSRIFAFKFNLFSLHFMQGNYRNANRWLSRIINSPSQDYRRDIQDVAPLLQMLLLASMEDHDLLASRLRAWRRMSKPGAKDGLASVVIPFCTQLIKQNPAARAGLLEELESGAKAILAKGVGTMAGVGETLFWAVGQQRNLHPGDVYREYMSSRK